MESPGDRVADNGTLWLEYPIVGGPSPDIPINFASATPEFYCHHSSRIKAGDMKWITASGAENFSNASIKLTNSEELSYYSSGSILLKLKILNRETGFLILLSQGEEVLKNFDILKEAGSPYHSIGKEFKGIKVNGDLHINLIPHSLLKNNIPPIILRNRSSS